MSLKARPQPETELDHIRDTLTDVVGVVGETRQGVKQLNRKVDANHKEVCERLDQQDASISELKSEVLQIKETMELILSRLPAN